MLKVLTPTVYCTMRHSVASSAKEGNGSANMVKNVAPAKLSKGSSVAPFKKYINTMI